MKNLLLGILIGMFLIPTFKEIKIRTRYTCWFRDNDFITIIYEFFKDVFNTTFFSNF